MTFEADLKTHLAADSGITALVSDRIYPMVVPQGAAMPALTFQHIGGQPMTNLAGGDGNLLNYRVQINCWSDTYLQAQALAELVRTRLQTAASTFKAVATLVPQDTFEPDPKRFGVYLDFSFWYRST
jgi:hypothetical protein